MTKAELVAGFAAASLALVLAAWLFYRRRVRPCLERRRAAGSRG